MATGSSSTEAARSCSIFAADPGETRDRSGEEAARVQRMRAALRAAVLTMTPLGDRAHTATITPEQEATLKSLGYVGGSGGGGDLDLAWPARSARPGSRSTSGCRSPPTRRTCLSSAPGRRRRRSRRTTPATRSPSRPRPPWPIGPAGSPTPRAPSAARRSWTPSVPPSARIYGKLLRDMDRLEESEKELRLALGQTDAQDARTRSSFGGDAGAARQDRRGRQARDGGAPHRPRRARRARRAGAAATRRGVSRRPPRSSAPPRRRAMPTRASSWPCSTSAWPTTGARAKPWGRCWPPTRAIPGPWPSWGRRSSSRAGARRGVSLGCEGRRRRGRGGRRPGSASRKASRRPRTRCRPPVAATPPNRFEQASVRTPTGMPFDVACENGPDGAPVLPGAGGHGLRRPLAPLHGGVSGQGSRRATRSGSSHNGTAAGRDSGVVVRSWLSDSTPAQRLADQRFALRQRRRVSRAAAGTRQLGSALSRIWHTSCYGDRLTVFPIRMREDDFIGFRSNRLAAYSGRRGLPAAVEPAR